MAPSIASPLKLHWYANGPVPCGSTRNTTLVWIPMTVSTGVGAAVMVTLAPLMRLAKSGAAIVGRMASSTAVLLRV